MNVSIRPARPEDADACVPHIYSSGPAAFDYVFAHRTKVPAQGFLHRAFQHEGGEFGFGNHTVVELDGAVVGTGAGFSGDTAIPFLIQMLQRLFAVYGPIGVWPVIARGMRLESMIPPPKSKEELYIAHLGVSAEMRGRGIGERLIENLLEQGRAQGRTYAALDVSMENPRAEALYERLGFKVTKETPSTLENAAAKVPGHRRMELSL